MKNKPSEEDLALQIYATQIVEGPPRSVVQRQLCRIKRTDVRQKEQKKNDAILQNNPQIDDK